MKKKQKKTSKRKKSKIKEKIKAVSLLSGGLDSIIATKLIKQQGIGVYAINFTSPFCLCNSGGCSILAVAKQLKVPLEVIPKGEDYLEMIRKPKHGYGKNMNPCIDCRIYILKKAKDYAKKIDAKFIFTGEVLDERPMSQHRKAMDIIEREAGLKGKLLRPLSAKLLPKTEAENKGWIDREKLLGIRGRGRKIQMKLAKKWKLKSYPCPAGGCLLTYAEFSSKLKDLFKHKGKISIRDIQILKIGRHFRYGKNKIIVGRNEIENKTLAKLKETGDYLFEVPNVGSPITILQGAKTKKAIEKSASLTLRYSDAKGKRKRKVKYGKTMKELNQSVIVSPITEKEIEKLRMSKR